MCWAAGVQARPPARAIGAGRSQARPTVIAVPAPLAGFGQVAGALPRAAARSERAASLALEDPARRIRPAPSRRSPDPGLVDAWTVLAWRLPSAAAWA